MSSKRLLLNVIQIVLDFANTYKTLVILKIILPDNAIEIVFLRLKNEKISKLFLFK